MTSVSAPQDTFLWGTETEMSYLVIYQVIYLVLTLPASSDLIVVTPGSQDARGLSPDEYLIYIVTFPLLS